MFNLNLYAFIGKLKKKGSNHSETFIGHFLWLMFIWSSCIKIGETITVEIDIYRFTKWNGENEISLDKKHRFLFVYRYCVELFSLGGWFRIVIKCHVLWHTFQINQ